MFSNIQIIGYTFGTIVRKVQKFKFHKIKSTKIKTTLNKVQYVEKLMRKKQTKQVLIKKLPCT